MRARGGRAVFAAAVVTGAVAGGVAAPSARADVQWLCRPGIASNPCAGDQTTRYFEPDGSSTVGKPEVPANPAIDCFYVYPTVSNQPTMNATKSPDPEVRSIALYQAQRFSTRCRIFVPLYRQVTAAGVTYASNTHDTKPYETAFADVEEAWLQYLKDDNQGRGFVLIGHSQGSRMMRALIRRDIDPNPAVRDRMVSAIIPGANATVAKGRRIGGDFASIPACDAPGQIHCVIAYSTFNETPPDNARFGRTDTDPVGSALGLPAGPSVEVLCTNPAALAGDGDRLASLTPSEPFAPGVIAALLLRMYGGPPPSADTPWLQPTDHYTGRCETSNNANVLMLSPVANARKLNPSPDATWGTHLVDVNIALGNLTKVVGTQTQKWLTDPRRIAALRRARGLSVRARSRRRGRTARVIAAIITGPPGLRARVSLRRGSHRVRRRFVRLDGVGSARTRFTVHRAGRYRVAAWAPGAGGGSAFSKPVRLRSPR